MDAAKRTVRYCQRSRIIGYLLWNHLNTFRRLAPLPQTGHLREAGQTPKQLRLCVHGQWKGRAAPGAQAACVRLQLWLLHRAVGTRITHKVVERNSRQGNRGDDRRSLGWCREVDSGGKAVECERSVKEDVVYVNEVTYGSKMIM